MYAFFVNNELISKHQSGFRPGDSTINQLLAITDEIFKSFESHAETRAAFLDISKAFDKVWHDGLLYKLKRSGISGRLLLLIGNFLSDRKQRVVLNGKESAWLPLNAGVPQGSVLGPLLFLIYINDLTENISSNMRLFADDSSLFIKVRDVAETQSQLMDDLDKITNWAHQWKMEFNPDITRLLRLSFRIKRTSLLILLFFSMVSRARESRIPSIWALFSINVSISVYIFRKKLRRPTKALAC